MHTHTVCAPLWWFSTHKRGAAFRRSYILWNIRAWKMNDEFIGVSLHISLHSKAACNVGKCVNRYRVCVFVCVWCDVLLCFLPSFIVASPPFIIIVVCCFEFWFDDVPSTPRFYKCVCIALLTCTRRSVDKCRRCGNAEREVDSRQSRHIQHRNPPVMCHVLQRRIFNVINCCSHRCVMCIYALPDAMSRRLTTHTTALFPSKLCGSCVAVWVPHASVNR